MIRFIQILLFFVFCTGGLTLSAQQEIKPGNPVLFTDRNSCVSGDTVWFKVWLPEQLTEMGNVVRVQLDGAGNNLIAEVACINKNSWSEGFIPVPDSLSTGQYFLSAFLNSQRNLPDFEIEGISLMVFNRFEEQIYNLENIHTGTIQDEENAEGFIQIETDKTEYQQRENVSVKITMNLESKIRNVVFSASLVDPVSTEIGNRYTFKVKPSDLPIPGFMENDGVLISGKVVNSVGVAQPHAVVILSLAGDPPYFDYYYTGEMGDFHFFLKNATGMAHVVLQVISGNEEEFFIRHEENYLLRDYEFPVQSKILKQQQVKFISEAISGNFIHKLFYPGTGTQLSFFEMPSRFKMPFYGTPSRRVIPDEFIDLPDFQEISRELLHGFQYRVKKDVVTFRMLNDNENTYFDDEPLRLINGIPVFKNNFFSGLKSTDIEYIDIVQKERIFGDLRFKGILSLVLRDKTNLWMAQQPGVAAFYINCLQPAKKPGYLFSPGSQPNLPDVRRNYSWQIIGPQESENIRFQLSDLKGNVEVSVEGITIDNKRFKTSKIIEVK